MDEKKIRNKQKQLSDNRSKDNAFDILNSDFVESSEVNLETIQNTKKEKNITAIFNKDALQESRMIEQKYEIKTEIIDVEPPSESSVPDEEKDAYGTEKNLPAEEERVTDVIMSDSTANVGELNDSSEKSGVAVISEEKGRRKDIRPSTIELKDKSDAFKKIIDVALAYEKVETDRKKLRQKVRVLDKKIEDLVSERDSLKSNLAATELLCQKKQEDIDKLQADIEHRNQVIDIIKADKNESAQEFKNALAAALRSYMQDFQELKTMVDKNDDLGCAMVDTLEEVFKVLDNHGINI